MRQFLLSKNICGFLANSQRYAQFLFAGECYFSTNSRTCRNLHSHWLKQTSRRLPNDFFHRISKENQINHECFDELTSLINSQEYEIIMQDFFNHDPEFINFVIRTTLAPCPNLDLFDSESEIEISRHRSMQSTTERLPIDDPFYDYIYKRIPKLYEFCQQYETMMFKNEVFFEYYVWLCYHMNDLTKLQHLSFGKNQYHCKTWGYLISAFIQNYEVDFAKSIFQKLCRNPLDGQLLEITLTQLVSVDTLFENIAGIFDCWVDHGLEVTPKALAIALEQYHKYGTPQEIDKLQAIIKSLNYEDHYRIRSVNLQYDIISQSKNYKKEITMDNLNEFSQITQTVDSEMLPDFYFMWLQFFAKYSNMSMIQLIVTQLKEHNIAFSDKFFQIICQYYTDHNRFLQLLELLQSRPIKFNEIYLYNLFDSFVKTYPYHAPNFEAQLHQWIHNTRFDDDTKSRLLHKLTITKIQSQITPYNVRLSALINKPMKYNSVFWKDIPWNSQGQGRLLKEQMAYRINKGFGDILRKGVRPDSEVLTKTFRRADMNNKKIIMDLLKSIRTYDHNKTMYELYILQGNQTKETLSKYYRDVNIDDLTINGKIMFSRMLMNKGLYSEAREMLSTIPSDDLDDKTKMVKFIIEIRNYSSFGKYDDMDATIDQFPIDDVVLSPYILNQCMFIEKKLQSKLSHNKQEHPESDNHQLQQTIVKLQGLIGDIEMRLENDAIEIGKTLHKMVKFLDKWSAEKQSQTKRTHRKH